MTSFVARHCTAIVALLLPVLNHAEVSFQQDLVPLLNQRCAACHITGEEPGQMALVPNDAYQSLVNAQSETVEMLKVQPHEPDKSYLLYKLKGTHRSVGGKGARMPFHQGPLKKADIALFEEWIIAGAQNN